MVFRHLICHLDNKKNQRSCSNQISFSRRSLVWDPNHRCLSRVNNTYPLNFVTASTPSCLTLLLLLPPCLNGNCSLTSAFSVRAARSIIGSRSEGKLGPFGNFVIMGIASLEQRNVENSMGDTNDRKVPTIMGGSMNQFLEMTSPFNPQPDNRDVESSLTLTVEDDDNARNDITETNDDDDDDDMQWSMWSNTFFVTGGLIYLLATSWDYSNSLNLHVMDDSLIGADGSDGSGTMLNVLWFLGPFVYLLNSVIDVLWALKSKKKEDDRRRHLKRFLCGRQRDPIVLDGVNGIHVATNEIGDDYQQIDVEDLFTDDYFLASQDAPMSPSSPASRTSLNAISPTLLGESEDHATHMMEQSTTRRHLRLQTIRAKIHKIPKITKKLVLPTKKLFRRLRKHMGHRRELSAAFTFGIAAFLSVCGAVCSYFDDENLQQWAEMLESGSIHVYLVSALFALWKPPCSSSSSGSRSEEGCDVVIGADGLVAPSVAQMASEGVETEVSSWHQSYVIFPFRRVHQTLTCITDPFIRPFYSVDSLETLGDAFFGIASVVDVILQDSTFDDNVLWWPIVSAWLWTLDALLYLRGDFVGYYDLNDCKEDEIFVQMQQKHGNVVSSLGNESVSRHFGSNAGDDSRNMTGKCNNFLLADANDVPVENER